MPRKFLRILSCDNSCKKILRYDSFKTGKGNRKSLSAHFYGFLPFFTKPVILVLLLLSLTEFTFEL